MKLCFVSWPSFDAGRYEDDACSKFGFVHNLVSTSTIWNGSKCPVDPEQLEAGAGKQEDHLPRNHRRLLRGVGDVGLGGHVQQTLQGEEAPAFLHRCWDFSVS